MGADTARIVVSGVRQLTFGGESSNRQDTGFWSQESGSSPGSPVVAAMTNAYGVSAAFRCVDGVECVRGAPRLAAFMRIRCSLAAAVAALLVPAAPAFAGDPTMPLWQVQAGMQCTGYSVIQGTTISSFDVRCSTSPAARRRGIGNILIQVSGPAVDATGIGPGFSGSPIYCPDEAGVQPGDRGDLAVGQRVRRQGRAGDADRGDPRDAGRRARERAARAASRRRDRRPAIGDAAKPIASPLTVSGLSAPLANALTKAAAKAGRPVLAVPPGPLGTFPAQTLRPGSAVAVGYSNGDVRTSAVGTVAYVDGDRMWVFGHQLEGNGRRALLLQDAYVFRVINNPLQLGRDRRRPTSSRPPGTTSGRSPSDGFAAVAGRTGVAAAHRAGPGDRARPGHQRRARRSTRSAADEAAVDLPSGGSWTSFVAPLAVAQAANGVLGSTPGRLTGEMCARIAVAEIKKPLRFCNRYVSASG